MRLLRLLRRRVIEPPLLCWPGFGDFGDPDFGEAERDFGEAERCFGEAERCFGEAERCFGDLGDPGFGEAERRFGEGERDFGDFAHRLASLSAFACGVSDWSPKRSMRAVLRLVTLFLRYPLRSGIPYIPPGGINFGIRPLSTPRTIAIFICVSIFNILQSHKFAVPSSQPVAKNLPLG